eukprot:COSAG04_NODE_1530_length_6451_cov_2.039830_5_plen_191_part_00
MAFRTWPERTFVDWHPAPQRQLVTVLSGELVVTCGDGSSHTFRAGDLRLVEDIDGGGVTTKGHTTVFASSGAPCVTATVALEDQQPGRAALGVAPPTAGTSSLSGQVAIVTGGAEGIGGGISRRLAQAGAHVLVADINADLAQATVDEIRAAGGVADALGVDVGDSAAVEGMVGRAVELWGRLDILVNNG